MATQRIASVHRVFIDSPSGSRDVRHKVMVNTSPNVNNQQRGIDLKQRTILRLVSLFATLDIDEYPLGKKAGTEK